MENRRTGNHFWFSKHSITSLEKVKRSSSLKLFKNPSQNLEQKPDNRQIITQFPRQIFAKTQT